MRSLLTSVLILALLGSSALARPFDADALVRLKRLSDVQVSPDFSLAVYALRETDMEANKGQTRIWALSLLAEDAQPRPLTAFGSSSPRFSADGASLYFLSSRSGSSQVHRLDLNAPGEAVAVTDLSIDVLSFDVVPGGKHLLLSLAVFPDCADIACTVQRSKAQAEAEVTGQVYDRLFIRHWDTWKDGRQNHLYAATLGEGALDDEALRRLSVGLDGDVHSQPFGGDGDYTPSPDGQSAVFALRVAGNSEPWSTNFDLWQVPLDGSAPPRNLTADNPAGDANPVFSPDGQSLAWLAMSKPGFEADRQRILLRDLTSGSTREVAPDWDRSPGSLAFSRDGKTLLVTANDLGHSRLFAIDVTSGEATALSGDGWVGGFAVTGKRVLFQRDDLSSPVDLYSVSLRGGPVVRHTQVNAAAMAELQFGAAEQFKFAGWNDELVHGWVVKPVGYEQGQRYPLAFIVHGGPQGSMGNHFHYRWNPQTYAGQGYAVVFIDFHGSTGYGQAFTDSITGDWGGKPLVDLQKGLAHATQSYAFIDADRACALGASYGGYMMNWIAGAWADRFDCIVNHDGILDNRFMAWSTEELWFVEWEHGGPQHRVAANFEKFNPINLLDKWRTPMLVIHGQQDFRVPFEQGIATFTALQRMGIESRFLQFPDENHWVLKPRNSVQWHREVERWLAQYLGEAD